MLRQDSSDPPALEPANTAPNKSGVKPGFFTLTLWCGVYQPGKISWLSLYFWCPENGAWYFKDKGSATKPMATPSWSFLLSTPSPSSQHPLWPDLATLTKSLEPLPVRVSSHPPLGSPGNLSLLGVRRRARWEFHWHRGRWLSPWSGKNFKYFRALRILISNQAHELIVHPPQGVQATDRSKAVWVRSRTLIPAKVGMLQL